MTNTLVAGCDYAKHVFRRTAGVPPARARSGPVMRRTDRSLLKFRQFAVLTILDFRVLLLAASRLVQTTRVDRKRDQAQVFRRAQDVPFARSIRD